MIEREAAATVRVTALVYTSRGLRAVTAEAPTEDAATEAALAVARRAAW